MHVTSLPSGQMLTCWLCLQLSVICLSTGQDPIHVGMIMAGYAHLTMGWSVPILHLAQTELIAACKRIASRQLPWQMSNMYAHGHEWTWHQHRACMTILLGLWHVLDIVVCHLQVPQVEDTGGV